MAKTPSDVTDAELAVLQQLWDRGDSTIRELTDALYPTGGTAHYATVQKLLERLEAKDCVGRERSSVPHVFSARVKRGDLIDIRLQDLADKLCEGSIAPLLTQLVRGKRLSSSERKALGDLVDRLDRKGGKGGAR